jgi:hypothetical protein
MPGYIPLGFACTLIATFVIAVIYAKGCEGASGAAQGAQLGVLVGIFVACTFVGANYVSLNIGRKLALELAASALVQWTMVCIVIGLIYKPALAAAH